MADRVEYCADCGEYIHESYPHYEVYDDCWLCSDCALINGFITKEEYIKNELYCFDEPIERKWVEIINGKVISGIGKKPWEVSTRDRSSSGYQKWRTEVFTRDNFTCQICKKVGGELNAHHIKPYAKYKNERLDINNGITLCSKCHRTVHKTKDKKYLKGD